MTTLRLRDMFSALSITLKCYPVLYNYFITIQNIIIIIIRIDGSDSCMNLLNQYRCNCYCGDRNYVYLMEEKTVYC